MLSTVLFHFETCLTLNCPLTPFQVLLASLQQSEKDTFKKIISKTSYFVITLLWLLLVFSHSLSNLYLVLILRISDFQHVVSQQIFNWISNIWNGKFFYFISDWFLFRLKHFRIEKSFEQICSKKRKQKLK